MKDKIIQLMKSEGLTSSRLAEILEIQPSGISHLVSGRNKPGFDLLQKILRRFPQINPYWLMLDDEEMYRPLPLSEADHKTAEQTEAKPNLSDDPSVDLFSAVAPSPSESISQLSPSATPINKSQKIDLSSPRVKRVILLYDDDTCETYAVK